MKRKLTFLLFILSGAVIFTFISAPISVDASTDVNIVGMEVGSCFIFNIDQEDFAPAQYFAVNLAITDNLIAGFTSIRGDGTIALNYDLIKISYFISEKKPLVIDILVGGDGANITAGLNITFNIFEKKMTDALSTALKFKTGYLLTETSNPTGSIIVGLTGQVGF